MRPQELEMYFKQIDKIIRGTKFQTRRIVKPGERTLFSDDTNLRYVLSPSGRTKWVEGYDYAVSPGRGKPGVWWQPASGTWSERTSMHVRNGAGYAGWFPLRIRITEIRQERLQDISEADAKVEGVQAVNAAPYATGALDETYLSSYKAAYRVLWDRINTRSGTRWADNPLVWVLTFEVVR